MSGKPIDEAVRLLREYREAPKFSNDHDAIKRTVALEDEIDAFLAALTAAQQQGQAVAFDIERARTLADYVVGYARAVELKSLSSDACVALSDLHSMLHAQPMQQGGGEVVAHGFYDPVTGAYSESQHTPRWLPAVVCTAPPSVPVGVEDVVMAARNAENAIRNCAAAGQIGEGYVQYADDLRDAVQRLAQQPAAVGVKTLSEFMAEQEALHPGIHDKVQAATDELRASLAQQPAAVDEAAAIRAFEEHFEASSDDPYFEGELELWLTAWRKALAAQQPAPPSAPVAADWITGDGLQGIKAEAHFLTQHKEEAVQRAGKRLLDRADKIIAALYQPPSAPVGVEAVRGAWLAAITLANNICVQESDRENDRDGDTGWIDGTAECAKRIREYAHPTDAELLEMLDEAGANAAKAALAQQPAAVDRARFRKAPCYLCGYNGPGYFQPETHPCAALYHAAQHQEPATPP